MKKVLTLALVIAVLLCSVSFAAKDAPKPAAKDTSSGPMSFGLFGATPTVKYNFTKDLSYQAGISYASSGGTNTLTLLLAGSSSMYKVGTNDITLGGMFNYLSTTGFTSMTVGLTYGAKTRLNSNVELEFLVVPVSYTSPSAGSTTLNILGNAVIAAHIYM